AAGRRSQTSVPRDLCAAANAHSTGTGHRQRYSCRADGARHARQGTARTGQAMNRLRLSVPTLSGVMIVASLAVITISAAQAPQTPPSGGQGPPRPTFRTGVDLVSLSVTVTDGNGHYVTDLEQDDFSVFEDGVKQDLSF